MKPLTASEQAQHRAKTTTVRYVVAALRDTRLADESEDVAVALARLENWIAENAGRWVA